MMAGINKSSVQQRTKTQRKEFFNYKHFPNNYRACVLSLPGPLPGKASRSFPGRRRRPRLLLRRSPGPPRYGSATCSAFGYFFVSAPRDHWNCPCAKKSKHNDAPDVLCVWCSVVLMRVLQLMKTLSARRILAKRSTMGEGCARSGKRSSSSLSLRSLERAFGPRSARPKGNFPCALHSVLVFAPYLSFFFLFEELQWKKKCSTLITSN